MRAHLRARTGVAFLVPAVMTIAVACGGGPAPATPTAGTNGALSLEGYFEQVEDALARAEATPLEHPFPAETLQDPAATLGEKKQAVKDYVSSYLAVQEELVADLESLDPPSEVEDAHQDYLLAFKGANLLLEDFRDQVDAIESDADLTPMAIDEAFAEAFASGSDACVNLQAVADSNDIDVQLNCSNR